MSCNNYLACYSSYYSCPNPCSTSYYNKNCCNSCQPARSPCVVTCPAPCPAPCPPVTCPAVSYITFAPTATLIPTGTVGVAPTPIPAGATTIPAGTVTPITGFTGVPTTNIGGVTLNTTNGQFTVPIAGRYIISAYVGFSANPVGTREVYIYRIDATTGIISLLASDSRNATVVGTTNATVTTTADLSAGDRIFFAVAQNSGTTLTSTSDSRFAITRLC